MVEVIGGSHSGNAGRIVLTGRFTRIPPSYKWFRGSLVNIELGLALRSLCIGLELFGLSHADALRYCEQLNRSGHSHYQVDSFR